MPQPLTPPSDSASAGDAPGRGARADTRSLVALVVAGMCVAFAAAVLWVWLTPDLLARLGAVPLVALLALFVLPALVTWLARLDRRLARHAVDRPSHRPE